MIRAIVRRELLDWLQSLRFIAGCAMVMALVALSTVINVNDFKQRRQDYAAARQEMKSDPFYIKVFRPPEVLSVLAQGKDRALGNAITFTFVEVPAKTSGYMGGDASQHHRHSAGFPSIDFVFVVRVLMSLLVVFLGYNVISQEKTQGTLRLIFSNPVPRHLLLIGKATAGLSLVVIILLAAAAVGLIIVMLQPSISLTPSDWARVGVILLVSVLYLASFFLMSMLVSVLINRPSVALTVLLQAWLFLTVIYPNLAVVAADRWCRVPGVEEVEQRKEAAWLPHAQEFKKVQDEFDSLVKSAQALPPGLWLKQTELSVKRAETRAKVDKQYSDLLSAQVRVASLLGAFSPSCLYDQIVQRYARTGMAQYEQFMAGVRRLWQANADLAIRRVKDPAANWNATLPPFAFTPDAFMSGAAQTAPYLLALLLMCVAFFMTAFMCFLRKDVR